MLERHDDAKCCRDKPGILIQKPVERKEEIYAMRFMV